MQLKTFLPILLLLSMQQFAFARPTAPVTHSHGGRIHTHPLPYQGLSHRHGNSPSGVAVENKHAGQVVGSIDDRKKVTHQKTGNQPPKQVPSTSDTIIDMAKGDTHCRSGELDCNVCAVNVQRQFNQAANGKLRWSLRRWNFNWRKPYPPKNTRPVDIFDGDPVYTLGIPDKHIQGFVRTNSQAYPYAGSHSNKHKGGIFVLSASGRGTNLFSLHKTQGWHPSAVHIYGQFLVYGDNKKLVFLNINSQNQRYKSSITLPKRAYGGGLGITRLSKDNALLITTTPGGQKSGKRYHRFYHVKTNQGKPVRIDYLNQSLSSVPRNWPKSYQFSENLSLITECGTGDIYSIHTTGNEKGVSMIRGRGFWRLSKLNKVNGKLQLDAINGFSSGQNMVSCNMRATATVFVNQNNKLEFYCHAYAKDPDGSLFNVLGPSSHNADKFYFRVGIIR